MELRQLRALVALAEERHFTRAAARLHIAQPALSKQIKTLEAEIGLTLVDRAARSVALTEAGSTLVVRARKVLAEMDAASAEMRDRAGLRSGTLTLGMTQIPGQLDLPQLLADFHLAHPGIALVVREDLSRDLAEALRRGALDLAFITELDAGDVQGLDVRPLVDEPLDVVVGAQHRHAARRRVRLRDLRDENFVVFRQGSTIRDAILEAAGRAGFVPRLAFEVSDTSRLRSLVAQGLGVAVLPRSEASSASEGVRAVAVDDPAFVHRVAVASRAGARHGPATAAFLRLVAARLDAGWVSG